ncbi:MAG: nitroreductase family protein [Fibrobacterales bacterium]
MTLDQLQSRYSVKKFDTDKKVNEVDLEIIKKSFHLAPSSINLQAWKLFVVDNPEMKQELAAAGRDTNGKRIEECSHLLVFAQKKASFAHIKRVVAVTEMFQIMMERRGISPSKLAGFFWLMSKALGGKSWVRNQLYLAFGYVMATCATLGVGSLPMEGIRKGQMNKVLGIGTEYKATVVLAIGYPHADDETNPSRLKKSRFPFEEVVEHI